MNTYNIIYILLAIIAIVFIAKWSNKNTDKMLVEAQQYEDCVEREYNTTPTAWYSEHGEYPECNK